MEGADQSTELWLCLCFSPSTPFFLSVFLSVFFSSLLFHQSSSVKNISREEGGSCEGSFLFEINNFSRFGSYLKK